MSALQIESIHIYPVKGLAGISRETAEIAPYGLRDDRTHMLIDTKGTFISQRTLPQMVRLKPEIVDESLRIKGHDGAVLEVPRWDEMGYLCGQLALAKVHNQIIPASEVGPEANEWFSEQLGQAVRLVMFRRGLMQAVDPQYQEEGFTEITGFSDGFPELFAFKASMASLNEQLHASGEATKSIDNFRPNIVIEGGSPFEEDYYRKLRIREALVKIAGPCKRCAVPNVNQQTGEIGRATTRALGAIRSGQDLTRRVKGVHPRGMFFGVNAMHALQSEGMTIQVGDEVKVVERTIAPHVII